jgi:TrmH family RNA methyltransferase
VRAVKPVTSADNPLFKSLCKLARSARERRKAGLSLIEGVHLLEAYLQHGGTPDHVVISAEGAARSEIINIINNLKNPLIWLSDTLFGRISVLETSAGILAAIKTPHPQVSSKPTGACVLLEDIQDPGNIGSILRSTAAAGVTSVYLSRGCADAWSPRTLRAGMGAHFALQIFEDVDLIDFARRYQGRLIAACQRASQNVFEADLTSNVALIFGNEGAGVSKTLRDAAQLEVSIPMPGKSESLNVAAAAAVCLFERVRQMKVKEARGQTAI